MPITTSDILGSDQVGIYLAACGNVVFHPHELNEEALNRIDEYLGLERHPLTIGGSTLVGALVTGNSKGKGFQGVVKRHGFAGVGDATHGQHNRMRAPGSIGAASYPAKVFKGMRMAGQMGNQRVKVENLEVLNIDIEKNIIVVKGAVPGFNNSFILIEK